MSDIDLNALVERLNDYGGPSDMVRDCRKAGAEITRLRAINAQLLAALKAVGLAYYGVSFKAFPEQMPAIQAASDMAFDALTAAEKG